MTKMLYTKDHEYLIVDGGVGAVGVTDFAQSQLGDVVFVELPQLGAAPKKGEQAAVVESVKAASEVYSPVSGEVVEVNGISKPIRRWSTRTRRQGLVLQDQAGR